MAKEQVKLEVPIVVKIDPKSVKEAERDFKALQKSLAKASVDWTKLGKTQQVNAKELMKIGAAAAALGSSISRGAQDAGKKLGSLGKAIDEAKKEAAEVAKKMGETSDPGAKAGLSIESKKVQGVLSKLYKQVESQSKVWKNSEKNVKAASKAQRTQIDTLKKAGNFSLQDMFKGVFDGISRGGLGGAKDAIGAVGKGAISGASKAGQAAAGEGAGAESAMAAMGSAVTIIGGVVVAVGALVKLLMMASAHQTQLNKALLKGSGFANDMGMANDAYRKSVDQIRTATINSAESLLRFGKNSESAMADINAFGMAATGSIAKTKVMMEQLGGGNLEEGIKKFVTSATVYGKALGVESGDVAKMMGDFVSDIGISHEHVVGVMDNIVKTAAMANIPVHKMMDVFHNILPDVSLFNNRMEELIGTVKLLSKTMDAKAMKSFMKTMGQGFDQLDFKQRLKMAFVIGPAKVANILQKDFTATGKAIGKEFGGLGDEVQAALKQADPVKAMAAVAAKATALGVAPAAIGKAQELARSMASLKKGDVLNVASAMKGAGMYARMTMLESTAGAFDPSGALSGLGEVTATAMGINAEQLKAILALKDNMAMYNVSIAKTGKTSSKSLNESLRKTYRLSKAGTKEAAASDDEVEKSLAKMAQADPKGLEEMLKQAAAEQMASTKSQTESAEDLAAENYNVQASISDKLESVVGFFLEKIFNTLQPILSLLEEFFDLVSAPDPAAKALVAAQKSVLAFQVSAAQDAEKNQQALLKSNTELTDVQKKKVGGDLAGMTSLIKTAASKTSFGDTGGVEGQITTLKPMLDKMGDMSVAQFEMQKKAFGGEFFRGDPDQDKRFLDILKEIEKAKAAGDTAKVEELKKKATETTTASLGYVKGQAGGEVKMMNNLGRVAGALAGGGTGVGAVGDPTAIAATKRQTDAQKKANDLVSDSNDVEKDFVQKMGGAQTGVSSAADTVPAAVVGAPGVAVGAPPGAPPGAATKTPEPPPGHDAQVKVMEDSGKSQEEIAKYAADDYQNTSDLLSLMKKGIKFEDSWMKNKYANVLKTSTLDSFRTALLEFAVIEAKMGDESFKKSLAASGEDLLGSGLQLKDLAGAGSGENDIKNMIDKAKSHATGLMGVPYDNYLASLHKGEIVMPASDARVAGKGGGGGKTTNVVVYAQGVPASEVARRIGQIANTD